MKALIAWNSFGKQGFVTTASRSSSRRLLDTLQTGMLEGFRHQNGGT